MQLRDGIIRMLTDQMQNFDDLVNRAIRFIVN